MKNLTKISKLNEKLILDEDIQEVYLEEGKYGFVKEYKGYRIMNTPDYYVITDKNGTTITQTKWGLPVAEAIIDDIIEQNNNTANESLEEDIEEEDDLLELEEPMDEEPIEDNIEEPVEEVTQEMADNAYLMQINDLIASEYAKIDNVKSIIATFDTEDAIQNNSEVISILNTFIDDTTISIGMLTKASELVDSDASSLMQQGIEKAEEVIGNDNEEEIVEESLTEEQETTPSATLSINPSIKKINDNTFEVYLSDELPTLLYRIDTNLHQVYKDSRKQDCIKRGVATNDENIIANVYEASKYTRGQILDKIDKVIYTKLSNIIQQELAKELQKLNYNKIVPTSDSWGDFPTSFYVFDKKQTNESLGENKENIEILEESFDEEKEKVKPTDVISAKEQKEIQSGNVVEFLEEATDKSFIKEVRTELDKLGKQYNFTFSIPDESNNEIDITIESNEDPSKNFILEIHQNSRSISALKPNNKSQFKTVYNVDDVNNVAETLIIIVSNILNESLKK